MLLRAGRRDRQAAAAGRKVFRRTISAIKSGSTLTKKNKKNFVSVRHVWLKFHPSIFQSPLLRVTGVLEHIGAVSRGAVGGGGGGGGSILDKSAVYRRATFKYKHPLALTCAPSRRLTPAEHSGGRGGGGKEEGPAECANAMPRGPGWELNPRPSCARLALSDSASVISAQMLVSAVCYSITELLFG